MVEYTLIENDKISISLPVILMKQLNNVEKNSSVELILIGTQRNQARFGVRAPKSISIYRKEKTLKKI